MRQGLPKETNMRLTYWYARRNGDSDVYSIRTQTRKKAYAELRAWGCDDDDAWIGEFEKPIKVTVEYASAFELMAECSHEGHHWWEAQALNKRDS
jgi:hypothetical protein